MPKILRKPSNRLRPDNPEPYDWLPLSNSDEHCGRKVRMAFGPHAGKIGYITRADTAHCGDYRRMYVTVELADVILTEVLWEDFIQVHS